MEAFISKSLSFSFQTTNLFSNFPNNLNFQTKTFVSNSPNSNAQSADKVRNFFQLKHSNDWFRYKFSQYELSNGNFHLKFSPLFKQSFWIIFVQKFRICLNFEFLQLELANCYINFDFFKIKLWAITFINFSLFLFSNRIS